jgi:hypothetical protein
VAPAKAGSVATTANMTAQAATRIDFSMIGSPFVLLARLLKPLMISERVPVNA